MSSCDIIKDITNRIVVNNESADDVIPLDMNRFSNECVFELLNLYIKYGNDNRRKSLCYQKLKEV